MASFQSAYEVGPSIIYEPVAQQSSGHGQAAEFWNERYEATEAQAFMKAPKKGFFATLRWWLSEMLASFLSLVSFASLVAVLRLYQGRGLQEVSLPSGLTLNGLIAIISTLNRVALMVPVASALSQEVWVWLSEAQTTRNSRHRGQLRDLETSDAASRGAWGSMLFLTHRRRSWLAYCAATVTIIALGFGTFTQQLLAFRSFPVASALLEPGNIARAESWVNFTGRPSEGALSVPISLKAATYNGILDPDVQPLTAVCPTGNCTWPVTPSLAICGGCSKSTFQLSCNGDSSSEMPDICEYKMPSGTQINLTDFTAASEGYGFQVAPGTGAVYDTSDNNTLYIANFDVVGAPANQFSTAWPESSTVASECALWMCVEAYETTQVNGNQTQVRVGTFSRVVNAKEFEATENFISNITFQEIPAIMNSRPGANYTVWYPAVVGLTTYFESMFNGSIYLNQGEQQASSDVVQAIWNSSAGLDEWIVNVAGSMTNVIRSTTPEPDDLYNGTGYQLGYDIRWLWIILPGFLVTMSLLILIAVIVKTHRSPVSAWKGSPLTLLFMDVDPAMKRNAISQMERFEGIQKLAGKTGVAVRREQTGNWCFKTE